MNTGRMRESCSYLPLFVHMFSFISSLSLLLVEGHHSFPGPPSVGVASPRPCPPGFVHL